jgi:hypothetical protein
LSFLCLSARYSMRHEYGGMGMGKRLTLSGSSALTLRPGLARSGSTHSFDGFANTFPAEEEVSLLPAPAGMAIELAAGVEAVEVDTELEREFNGGRDGIGILPAGLPLGPAVEVDGRARMAEADDPGREAMLGFIEELRGRGTATDMVGVGTGCSFDVRQADKADVADKCSGGVSKWGRSRFIDG